MTLPQSGTEQAICPIPAMHNAPALTYAVGRSRAYACLVALIALVAAVAGVLWLNQMADRGWRAWLYVWTSLATLALAVWHGARLPCGILQWDGQAWSWTDTGPARPVTLQVHADLLVGLVLGLRDEDGKRFWLWPERSHDPRSWSALRRAVFSRDGSVPAIDVHPQAQRSRVNR